MPQLPVIPQHFFAIAMGASLAFTLVAGWFQRKHWD